MAAKLSIGFIGAGKMAAALAKGFVRAGLVQGKQLIASDPHPAAREAFARELEARVTESNARVAQEAKVLILDEPTRGVDIAAKQEIMNEILALADQGMAVLFISSEMEEVVRVSQRIVVLRDRAIVGELPAGSADHAVYAMIAGQA